MAKLSIANIVTVTLTSALSSLEDVNTSALALITNEEPLSSDYGTSGIYLSPDGVADDFGSSSDTYRMAVMVFSQSPNIVSGGGYLVVIPRTQDAIATAAVINATGTVDLTALTTTDYYLNALVDDDVAGTDLLIGEIDTTSLATATASLNSTAITAAGLYFTVSGSLSSATITLYTTSTGADSLITLGTSSTGTDIASKLKIAGESATGAAAGIERVKDTVLRTAGSVNYFGIIMNEKQTDDNLLELAKTVQTKDMLLFAGSNLSADIAGIFTTILNSTLTHTRCLYYSIGEDDALDFSAGYAARGMSINFSGFNTAHTMHLKTISGIVGDTGMSQTLLTACGNAGVDFYGDFGVPRVFTSGANQYFDQIYTRLALKVKLQIAGFNFLATTNTKIPQTEQGMNGLKGAYRKVCKAFVENGVFAPGTWTSSTTFGNPEDHIRNINDQGYYIYSTAIADQSITDRNARVAPSIYIACKDAGAIHSSDVTVYVEA